VRANDLLFDEREAFPGLRPTDMQSIAEIIRYYLAALAISCLAWPALRCCALRPIGAWIAARILAPFAISLGVIHFCRWTGLPWSGPLVWAVALGVAALGIAVGLQASRAGARRRCVLSCFRLRAAERRFLIRFEAALALCALLLAVFIGKHYGNHALGERIHDAGLIAHWAAKPQIPPPDNSFSGGTVRIYYLGLLTASAVGKAAGLAPHRIYFCGLIFQWLLFIAACLFLARVLRLRRWRIAGLPLLALAMGSAAFLSLGLGAPLIQYTRIIPYTINEIPSMALWVAEVHAHLFALPLFVLWVGLVIPAIRRRRASFLAPLALTAVCLAATDSWFVLPAALWTLALAAIEGKRAWQFGVKILIPFLAICVVLALPFVLNSASPPLRIRWFDHPFSRPDRLLILFGPLLVPLGFLGAMGGQSRFARRLGWLFAAAGLAVIVFCEIAYFDVGIPSPGERQNTTHRFHLIAWIFLAAACGAFWSHRPSKRWTEPCLWVWIALFTVLGAIPGLHSLGAAPHPWRWDARAALDPDRTGTLEAADWILRHAPPDAILAESAGSPYKGYCSVSAMSGRAAVLGEVDKARNHGAPPAQIQQRLDDLYRIYLDFPESGEILRRYGVRYIVLGPAEEKAFPGCRADALAAKYATLFRARQVRVLDACSQSTAKKN